jgi:hypothetical protein
MTRDDIIRLARAAGVPMEYSFNNGATAWNLHPSLERFAALVAEAALEEKPIAWMQRLQPEPPFETHNRITSVEEVARGWDNPIPLYARKGNGTQLWGIPDHERQAVCEAHYASEQQAIRARGKT